MITLERGRDRAVLAPERGGMATHVTFGGRELLFLDDATVADPAKNVRGGNPVLFPSPGPLAGGRFARDGRAGAMPQHGLARQRPWRVAARGAHEATLMLASDASTRQEFPWDFTLTFRYALEDGALRIEQRYACDEGAPMPFAAGFHPYFHVPDADKGRAAIPTSATRAWDNVAKREIALDAPIALAGREVDLHLVDHGRSDAALVLPDGARVVLEGSEAFRRWVIWTLPGKDFVCLEPWTAAANALNDGDGLLVAPARGAVELALTMRLA